MFFFGLAVFSFLSWAAPWGSVPAAAFVLGMRWPRDGGKLAVAGGISWMVLAYIGDGMNSGLVSQRTAAIFSLPHSVLAFALVGVTAFVTVWLAWRAGVAAREFRNIS